MPRGDSLVRQLELIRILEDRRELAVPDVAQELGYTVRTVYRDLAVLERIGVPIYQERKGKKARWRVVEGYRRRMSVTLSWVEALALAAGQKMLGGLAGTVFADGADAALKKIVAALPGELSQRAVAVAERLSAAAGAARDYRALREPIRVLTEAVEKRHTVRIDYRTPSARAAAERLVDPYAMHIQGGALYLFAWCHKRNGVRTFLLDRVRAATSTGQPFVARGAFSPALQGGFGPWEGKPVRVQARFDASVAPWVAEARVHASQRSQWRSDGGLDVELRVPICPPLTSWLLGWGASVEVLAPASLAKRIAAEHAKAARVR